MSRDNEHWFLLTFAAGEMALAFVANLINFPEAVFVCVAMGFMLMGLSLRAFVRQPPTEERAANE